MHGPLARTTSGGASSSSGGGGSARRFDNPRLATAPTDDLVILTTVSTVKGSIVLLNKAPLDRSPPPSDDRADLQANLFRLDRKPEVTQSPFNPLLLDLRGPHLDPLGWGDELGSLVEEIDMEDDLMSSTIGFEADDQVVVVAGEMDLVVACLGGLGGFVEDGMVDRGLAARGETGGCEVDEAGHGRGCG